MSNERERSLTGGRGSRGRRRTSKEVLREIWLVYGLSEWELRRVVQMTNESATVTYYWRVVGETQVCLRA